MPVPPPLPAVVPTAPVAAIAHLTPGSPQRQAAAVAAVTARWAQHSASAGLAGLHCFTDGDSRDVLVVGQWTSRQAREQDLPHVIGDDVPDPRYERYRSLGGPPDGRLARCLATAVFAVHEAAQQREFSDRLADIAEGLPSSEKHPGALSAHLYLGADGRTIVNYTEWTDADAHREATEAGAHDRYYALFASTPYVRPLGGRRYVLAASARTWSRPSRSRSRSGASVEKSSSDTQPS